MNSLYSVIKKFIVTNKSTDGELKWVYTAMIDSAATKIDVKAAIRKLYGKEVAKVNINYTREKFHNTKTGVQKKKWVEKKAMITMKPGNRIENFEVIN
jgi:ribosomal protein L23